MTSTPARTPSLRRARLSWRARLALAAERAASGTSRRLGRGSGEMIGGKVAQRVDPGVLAAVSAGRPAACVSGTNGKTTTTRMLAAALGVAGPVASNSGGANMTPGVIHALARPPLTSPAALEVDEIWLPQVARAVRPRAVALLNISRDQLDRSNETRRIATLWRRLGEELGEGSEGCTAVANCDDPLVVYAAEGFSAQVWVSAGQNWTADAMVCPVDAALLSRHGLDWSCGSCGFHRPMPEIEVTGLDSVNWRGRTLHLGLTLPGRVNVGNAAIAAATAETFGVDVAEAFGAMATVDAVQGRYSISPVAPGRRGRLLLAKNPAGWVEMLELLDGGPRRPVVVDFNSRTADGRDPSWLWDVPFERLAGREVLVCGERREDVSVRLAYADVPHTVHDSVEAAARAATPLPGDDVVDVVANYTAFRDLLRRLEPAGSSSPSRAEPVR
jgi:UDP-N-acetylmuramyl tripeptide synthase